MKNLIKHTLTLLLFILLTLPVKSQELLDKKDWHADFIQSISTYRSTLLTNNLPELSRLVNTLDTWRKWEPDELVLQGFIFDAQFSYLHNGRTFSSIQRRVKILFPQSLLPDKFTEQQLRDICYSTELTDLISQSILRVKPPFQIGVLQHILMELEFYGITNTSTVAEIGAGKGLFSCFMAMLNGDSQYYINELADEFLEYIEDTKEKDNLKINWENVELIQGSKNAVNLPIKVEKIIIRNSFHHFTKKKKMLQSVANSLTENGSMFIMEAVYVDRKTRHCRKQLTKEKLKNEVLRGGFEIVNEFQLDYYLLLECKVKVDK